MDERERILQAIYKAVDQANQARPAAARLAKSPQEVLWGDGTVLDSLGIVNFVVAVEEEIAQECGVAVNLSNLQGAPSAEHPLRTIGSLAEHLLVLMERPA